MTSEEEQRIRDVFLERFYQIDSSFKPINHEQYEAWILESVNNMEPRDFEARGVGPRFSNMIKYWEH